MRKISGCLIVLIFSVAACMAEVKPLLKPADVDVATRIANQQKWLEQAITHKELTRAETKPVQEKLNEIKEKYAKLQAEGRLTAEDSKTINQMLDKNSDAIFRLKQKKPIWH